MVFVFVGRLLQRGEEFFLLLRRLLTTAVDTVIVVGDAMLVILLHRNHRELSLYLHVVRKFNWVVGLFCCCRDPRQC